MKIAAYNLLKGGSKKVHWVKLLEDHSVELLLLQESYAPDVHLPPLLYPSAQAQTAWETVESRTWGSAVFSKFGSVKRVPVAGFTGWVAGAEIRDASWQAGFSDPLLVFSVHAPSRVESYAKEFHKLLDEIGQIACGCEFVLGGDFNLAVSHSIASERTVSRADLAIQARLADEFGLLNCWQAANPNQPLPQTLRWAKDRTVPYHCDGIFVPKAWQPRLESCAILAGEEWERLSDHKPVVATFA